MKTTPETFMDEARMAAAQCWCDEETKHIEMDAVLAEAVARRIAAWMDTGAFHSRNETYWKQRAEAAEAKLRELEMQEPVGEVIEAGTKSVNWMILWKPGCRPKIGEKLYAKPFPTPKQEEK